MTLVDFVGGEGRRKGGEGEGGNQEGGGVRREGGGKEVERRRNRRRIGGCMHVQRG